MLRSGRITGHAYQEREGPSSQTPCARSDLSRLPCQSHGSRSAAER